MENKCDPPKAPLSQTFASPLYRVILDYPADWHQVSPVKFQGSTGFFEIGAVGGPLLEQACHNEAYHILKPYGSNPKIQGITFHRQPACYIFPSADQAPEMKDQSALIVKYPQPIQISGITYNYFILWANGSYIRLIANTLQFII